MKPAILIPLTLTAAFAAADDVRFNRDVRPILAEHCWTCHGPDRNARQAGLRLDVRSQAMEPADSGKAAIVAGDIRNSELVSRISTANPDLRMPPADFNRPLSAPQITTLKRWIEQGAPYQKHWSFRPIARPKVPSEPGAANAIDAFVGAKLRELGAEFSPQASRETLLRRVSLTLTGLPPALADSDRPEESYAQAVDRLLASPHFGEHMAVSWLDAARYADTNGYFGDKPRQMWLWRDWVINAFNDNMPFDRFTIEQLAGDLMTNPSVSRKIATGFNRNHMANNETGIIDEEYRVEYVVDRVDTTVTTWLGLTAGCAQCHDHKYDPISQREFYELFAFFNNVPEKGLITADNPPPLLTVTTPQQDRRLAELQNQTADARQAFEKLRPQLETSIANWEPAAARDLPGPPDKSVVFYEGFDGKIHPGTQSVGTPFRFVPGIRGDAAGFDATQHAQSAATGFDADAAWTVGFWIKPDGSLSCLLSKIEPTGRRRGLELLLQKGRLVANLVNQWGASALEVAVRDNMASRQWHHVVICYDGSRNADGLKVWLNGRPAETTVRRDTLSGSIACDEPLRIARRDAGLGYYGAMDELRIVHETITDDTAATWFRGERLRGILATEAKSRTARDRDFLLDDYLHHYGASATKAARRRMLDTQRTEEHFRKTLPTTLVMAELSEPRETYVLTRGQYDQAGEAVTPGVPHVFPPLPPDAPRNRLGFARWLMSDDNPLTARVIVNRLWQQCFGEGLVRTMNDFGTQGEPPSHPKLLDWLASEFRDSGWDVKHMLRVIVTSRTYQQQSPHRTDLPFDRENRWLGRGPDYRLSAEMIRDQALAVSGLLNRRIGGPSVRPYQPPGLWEEVSYNAATSYKPDSGSGLWRRSLYTYIKRQAPPPAFLIFDGVTREKCTIQRARTSTPLQSLVLLNDPTYVEAARVLAAQVIENEADDTARLRQLFRRVVLRRPDDDETRLLNELVQRQRHRFAASERVADGLLSVGEATSDSNVNPAELAAWTVVAQTVLNLDEAIHQK